MAGTKTSTPIFTQHAFDTVATLSTVNTDRTGASGSFDDLRTGSTNDDRIEGLKITLVSSSPGCRIYLYLRTSGGTRVFLSEISVPQVTPSESVPAWSTIWRPPSTPFLLRAGAKIQACVTRTATFHVIPLGGEY